MRLPALAFLMAALLSGCLGCAQSRDYSGFTQFTFEQGAGLGFCPDTALVYTAALEESEPNTFTFNATMLQTQPGVPVDSCATDFQTFDGCMEPVALPARVLSPEERDRVRAVFADVTVEPSPDAMCRVMGIDPCRILSFQWDDDAHGDFVCSENRLEAEQADVLVDLLRRLQEGG